VSSEGQSDIGWHAPALSAMTDGAEPPLAAAERPEAGPGPAEGPASPVVLVLGAGLSRRYGGDKLAARLPDGRELGAATLAVACAAWPRVACVVRPGTRMAALAAQSGVQVVECAEAVDGMGHSLAAGVRATRGAGGWVVMLADMPAVRPDTIRAVARALVEGATVAFPVHRGQRGHPVGLHACLGDELTGLRGDEGARAIVARRIDQARPIEVDDPGVLSDIDTPVDLARASQRPD